MEKEILQNPIPLEIAAKLCEQIRTEANTNWHTAAARWCWHCQKTSEDPSKPGYLGVPGNRGCHLVNIRFAEYGSSSATLL